MIRFDNVSFFYTPDHLILRQLTFELGVGTFHFLTGASGAGKSSLLRMIYMASMPKRGRLTVFNRYVSRLKRHEKTALRRRIGVVFQDFRLLSHLTVLQNAALPLLVSSRSEHEAFAQAKEILDWVGLSAYFDAYPQTLSGGQQQRIAIVRAIVNKPDLLVADEPTGSVDEQSAHRFFRLFEELHKLGSTVIVATHNPSLLTRYQHPSLHIERGRVTMRDHNARTTSVL
ncbi:MAG: ATP-binding cassette domain-containing protein [Alphaproteobacteria bacterium GM7ARS4]|nr:ATP-binding cassette domain-containing protein [Alphaproteobacteria bacterium GM7ARS4]